VVKVKSLLVASVLIVAFIWIGGCSRSKPPADALLVSELLEKPVYDREVKLYGQVSLLHELFCPCFELTSDGRTVEVWYDLMSVDGRTSRPPVSVVGISNGDWVVVTGELRAPQGQPDSLDAVWASGITRLD
jgi:hypothetical protein